ncbi:MAG TPA: aspartyl protease family protein, partial [Sphingomonas sp.]|uniref:aspartyl protease family protein n=1 Tax=Sphingomonas sp. TaxID=28214 RepID=UPI002D1D7B9C
MRLTSILGFALMASMAAPVAAAAAQPVTVKLEPWRTRWVLPATIAGTTRKYLFDTGAGLSLVSSDTLKAAGCEPWGRMTGFRMMGQRGDTPRCEDIDVAVGGVTLRPPVLGTINMGDDNPKDAALDGVIGFNLFEDKIVTIDFAAGTLTIETEESRARRVATMQPIRVRLKREVDGLALAVAAAVPTARGTLWMELDSGNGGTILVSKPVAALVGMDAKQDGKQSAHFTVADNVV